MSDFTKYSSLTVKQPLCGWPWTEETNSGIYLGRDNWPKISIVTISYNQANYLEQTIRSVLLQNYPNLEYIVIDGGSEDGSIDIIRKYSSQISYWVSEKDNGQSYALNKGFKVATGEIAGWINSDDFYEKDAFYKVAKSYLNKKFSFFCGTCQMIDEEGKFIQKLYTKSISYSSLIRYWQPHFCPPQPSIFFKRDCLTALGYFNVELQYTMDYDIWLRASKKYSFYVVEDNISYYRVHIDSKTGSAGGLQKFIPEWKMLITKSMEGEPLLTKCDYYFNNTIYNVKKRIQFLLTQYQLKSFIKRWVIRTQIQK